MNEKEWNCRDSFEDNKNLNLFKYLVNKYKSAPFRAAIKKGYFKSIEKNWSSRIKTKREKLWGNFWGLLEAVFPGFKIL